LKKYGNAKWQKKPEVSEQNFTEGKVIHRLCSVMQCVKLSFMIMIFEKLREVMVCTFHDGCKQGIN